MPFREDCERWGNWLFRYRSYIPLLFLPVLAATFAFSKDLPTPLIHAPAWEIFCFLVSLLGIIFRIWVIGQVPPNTSGRNTEEQIAEVLNTTGPYSIVRHPLYLANFLIMLGVVSWAALWWLVLLFITLFWLYYERIIFAEEAFLRRKFGQQFEHWATSTPAFIPRFRSYRPSNRPFSWRKVLRQEYPGWINLPISFFVLEMLYSLFHPAAPIHWCWGYFAAITLLGGIVLRWLKYRTSLLQDTITAP